MRGYYILPLCVMFLAGCSESPEPGQESSAADKPKAAVAMPAYPDIAALSGLMANGESNSVTLVADALARADITFTIKATFDVSFPANSVKKRAITIKTGFPGGWPTSSLYAEAINSPQSQRLAVGSMVRR